MTDYIVRAHDHVLRAKVTEAARGVSGMATLIGNSVAGKKRAMWEALHIRDGDGAALAGWRVWPGTSPSDPRTLLGVIAGAVPRTVLWLPGLSRYLLDGGSDVGNEVAGALRDLLEDDERAPVLVLGTLRPRQWQRLTAPSRGSADPHPHPRLLLQETDIAVADTFTVAEVADAAMSADPRMAEAAVMCDGGEVIRYLVAAPEVRQRFRNATQQEKAILQCAIEARCVGHGQWLPRALLERAAPQYLTAHERSCLAATWFEDALAELTSPGLGEMRMMLDWDVTDGATARRDRLRLNDFLERQWITEVQQVRLPAEHLWSALVDRAAVDSVVALAEECRRRGLLRQSVEFYRRAIRDGDVSAKRALADMLRDAGHVDDALRLYRELADGPDLTAQVVAGRILLAAGRAAEVVRWVQPAASAYRPDALWLRALALSELGERDRAIVTYQYLAETGDLSAAAVAGELLAEAGRRDDAVTWLMTLTGRFGLDTVRMAAELIVEDEDEDKGGIDVAVARLHDRADHGEYGSYLVGAEILAAHERTEDACSWVDSAIEFAVPGAASMAARLYAQAGLFDTATTHARAAADAGDPTALSTVADALAQRRMTSAALDLYQQGAEHGDTEAWCRAVDVAARAGWVSEAIACLRRARRTGQSPSPVSVAAKLCAAGQIAEALDWYVNTVDLSSPDVLIGISDYLLKANVVKQVAARYARKTRQSDAQALAWVAEGLERAGRQDLDEAANRQAKTGVAVGVHAHRKTMEAVSWLTVAARDGHEPARVRAAELLLQIKRYEQVVTLLREIPQTRRTDAHVYLASALPQPKVKNDDPIGSVNEAITMVERQLDAGETRAVAPVAQALISRGRPEEAIVLLHRGIELGDATSHCCMGDYRSRTHAHAEALAHYLIARLHGHDKAEDKIEGLLTATKDFETLEDIQRFGITVNGTIAEPWSLDRLASDTHADG
ncbi:hypothetical protein [Amycolatopsis sp. CA-230715]|uniref:hypothetical protein n=1 Tax=Amycolatopsis sp. CA-230715 TaxID=2745196 RepID=UPI001C011991|nr:hypothetical protein [Amycolatopsis sp. CA-230715]